MNICDLKPGQKAIIKSICCDEKLTKRLLALGCIEGTSLSLERSAPLGDPLVINLRGFNLAIRKKDAENISITA
ncbi:ferrous iron transport protein A [Clostridium tyrobutyricum]|jgi:ferrous iron transport protein A|uniref:Ferrous iron transport protein A n=1 Tax=Clostridium tyrobutyricum DIVETGP TaxID=1408889 RepID=W6N2Z4_CLOTY|nr:ferrous iron transport protein A [Clostridium tyrobutyricum]AND84838.1 Fe2+ transport protein FeoA [Clostridium tyrobutyricum]ANP69420.1 iron transporter FeoA [Clostridium tyrobutyricum]MBR9647720.1 ferrous iron transport protein A [Clostridium tyrobutyricum]MBV4416017.1 ferrous iron transport protein A [Clostridium tyrobutyricum]MBV4422040.1 ferrous iron transport protein A [Clostridium tyrobutyricum]